MSILRKKTMEREKNSILHGGYRGQQVLDHARLLSQSVSS